MRLVQFRPSRDGLGVNADFPFSHWELPSGDEAILLPNSRSNHVQQSIAAIGEVLPVSAYKRSVAGASAVFPAFISARGISYLSGEQ